MKTGLLATGDELTNGDILNTNGQAIAQALFDAGFSLGNHVIVADQEAEIIDSIHYLQKQHEVIILTGGLGPTSDDRTRFALAKANDRDLFFDEPSWNAIIDRLTRYDVHVHESNRQQAYFPVGATVLPNPNGSAPGCRLETDKTLFFMLPGPPKECMPMFNDHVLPDLISHKSGQKFLQKKWRLFGVSEGEIAAELDSLVHGHKVNTGYRWDYPYLEFKLRFDAADNIDDLINELETKVARHSICTPKQTASELLVETLKTLPNLLIISDEATGGLLEHILKRPEVFSKITFHADAGTDPHIHISGLTELWQNELPHGQTQIQIKGQFQNKMINEEYMIPFRNQRVIEYAVEFISHKLNGFLNTQINM